MFTFASVHKQRYGYHVSSTFAFLLHPCRIRDGGGAGRPLPIHLRTVIANYISKLYIIGKGIYGKLRFYLHIRKIFQFCEFMNNFRKMPKNLAIFGCPKNFKLLKYERIIYDLKARDPEILNM